MAERLLLLRMFFVGDVEKVVRFLMLGSQLRTTLSTVPLNHQSRSRSPVG